MAGAVTFHVAQLANRALDGADVACRTRRAGTAARGDPLYRARRRLRRSRANNCPTTNTNGCSVCCVPVTLGRRCGSHGSRKKSFARSTTTPTPNSPRHGSQRSASTSRCPSRSAASDGTIAKWADQICAWHRSHVTNGPTEARQQLGQEDQAGRVRDRQFPTSPRPLPALRRQARLDPATHDPTPTREEPLCWLRQPSIPFFATSDETLTMSTKSANVWYKSRLKTG